MAAKKCVAVIFGGQSSEHNVSRVSAQYVIKNINADKYDVVMIGITKEGKWYWYKGPVEKLESGEWEDIVKNEKIKLSDTQNPSLINRLVLNGLDKQIDVIFPVLHGINGEDGTIQGVFELAQIPYVGCGVLSSAVSMDKGITKIILENAGILQADYVLVKKEDFDNLQLIIEKIEGKFEYPYFIKPANAGSSVGVSKSHNRDELVKGLKIALEYDRRILVEENIIGKEVECAVLGNENPKASTVGEIIPANEFYDYEAKYNNSDSKTLIPANLKVEEIDKIRNLAVEIFKALDCAGLSRVDFFVKDSGEIILNEINTLPGFTSISMYSKLWEASGIKYKDLIEELIDCAFRRFEYCKRKTV